MSAVYHDGPFRTIGGKVQQVFKRRFMWLLGVLLLACGGSDSVPDEASEFLHWGIKDEFGQLLDERGEPRADAATSLIFEPQGSIQREIGRAQQRLIFAPAGATQPGMQPVTFRSCFQGEPDEFCVVPRRKDFVYYFVSGTANQKALWGGVITSVRDTLLAKGLESCSTNGCWHFREATRFDDPDITVRISINASLTVSACQGSSDKVRQFYCYDGGVHQIEKLTPLSGTYATWNDAASLVFDEGEILYNLFLNSAQKMNRRYEVAALAILNFGGIGAVNTGPGLCMNEDLQSSSLPCELTATDVCRLNGFGDDADGGDEDHISIVGADCWQAP